MIIASLSDGPVFISNLAVLIETVSEILHEIDRGKAKAILPDLDRAASLMAIAHDSCQATVAAIEAGPDYVRGGAA